MKTPCLLFLGGVVLGAAVVAAGCTVNTTCETTADCDPAAVCVDGHCMAAGTATTSSGNTTGTSVAGTSSPQLSSRGTSTTTSGAGTSAASNSRASTSANTSTSNSSSTGSTAAVTSSTNSSSTADVTSSPAQSTSSAGTSNTSLASSAPATSSTTGGSTSVPPPGSSSSGGGSTSAPAPSSSQASCNCIPDETGCGMVPPGAACTNAGCRNVSHDTCVGTGGLCEGLPSYQCDNYPALCMLAQVCQGTPWECRYSCAPGCDAPACTGGSFDCSQVPGFQCSNFVAQGCFASFQCPPQCNNTPQGCSCQEQYVCRNSAVTPCSTVTDAQTCGFGGCRWECGGTPDACAGRQYVECNAGCSWGDCQAATGVCEAATTANACSNAGCTWNSSLKCSGPLTCTNTAGNTCSPGCICQ